jgi:thiamine-monophosphate kinase
MKLTGNNDEFTLINTYFHHCSISRADVCMGIGDDCAILRVPSGYDLAVSIDTLVAGVHFFPDCAPAHIGYKALAVGLSDLAATGATPAWATLALTLPQADQGWLAEFSHGLKTLAQCYDMALVGGDTTRGALTISIQVHGFVKTTGALKRSGAQPGDLIVVSGTLGDAGLALRHLQVAYRSGQAAELKPALRARLEQPIPRVALGLAICDIATAAIDLSDGLGADLGHLLTASGCGASVELAQLPLSADVAAIVDREHDWRLPVTAGDDYELCFTWPADQKEALAGVAEQAQCPLTVIGTITADQCCLWRQPNGALWEPKQSGYKHFYY